VTKPYLPAGGTSRRLLAWSVALVLSIGSASVSARSGPNLSDLDLSLEPTDVAPPQSSPTAELGSIRGRSAQTTSEIVGEVDRAKSNPTPTRMAPDLGPLSSLAGDEGLLKELLEDKTIPLFRIRVEPPF
jgi:hypothetical protein